MNKSKKALKALCILLSLTLLSSVFVGCGKVSSTSPENNDEESSAEDDTPKEYGNSVALPYNSKDTLNPFTCKNQNNFNLVPLLYSSLFKLDDSMTPQKDIANDITVSGTTVTVTINTGITFSDGSQLTASDVAYSITKAKGSSNYSNSLENIKSATGNGSTLTITLGKPDPYVANILITPIVKKDSDGDKIAIGSGKYIFSDSDNQTVLNYNDKVFKDQKPQVETINLVEIPSYDTMINSLEIGTIDFFYTDLSGGKVPRISGSTSPVSLNTLVYIGCNSNGKLSDKALRQAILYGVDRKNVVDRGYLSYATIANGLFPKRWKETEGLQNAPDNQDIDRTKSTLTDDGYTQNNGGFFEKDGKSVEFDLLINSDNPFKEASANSIADSLSKVGIKINVVSKPFDEYKKELEHGKFDLYLGEIKFNSNCDVTSLLTPSIMGYGLNKEFSCINLYQSWRNGENVDQGKKDFIKAFEDEAPIIPICHTQGLALFSRRIDTIIKPLEKDVFNEIEMWKPIK